MTQTIGTQRTEAHRSSGGRLVAADGRELPFGGAEIEAAAFGGVAEVTLRHLFVNDGDEPLEATYLTPIPAGAAVGGYSFCVGERRFVGMIEPREKAQERYRAALAEGRTAALLDEERSAIFIQRIGNIPPSAEVICELRLVQRLDWTGGAWEWRFPTVIAPRDAGRESRAGDAREIAVEVLREPAPARASVELRIADAIGDPESASHPISIESSRQERVIRLGEENGVRLDRDLVVAWPAASPKTALRVETARRTPAGTTCGLVTITPPAIEPPATHRDFTLVIDASASMSGAPLEQAKRAAHSMLDALRPGDRLEMIRFGPGIQRWRDDPAKADDAMLSAARRWVSGLEAGGDTPMREGLIAAMRPDHGTAPRHLILITDGLVNLEAAVARATRSLCPDNARVHAVGVGPAANRSLTVAVARAGGGQECTLPLDADPTATIRGLITRAFAPSVVGARAFGDALPEAQDLPDLMGGAPAVAALSFRPEGGSLQVRGDTPSGSWTERVDVAPCDADPGRDAVRWLYARDLVDRVESDERREGDSDAPIERLGLEHGISTRRTSWIAVSEAHAVDSQGPTKRVKVPQELPHGLSAEKLGLAGPSPVGRVVLRNAPARRAIGSGCRTEDPVPASAR